ncbi:MAG: hypothetical protein ACJ8FD_18080, partial [Bradyrhizobium canariense]
HFRGLNWPGALGQILFPEIHKAAVAAILIGGARPTVASHSSRFSFRMPAGKTAFGFPGP